MEEQLINFETARLYDLDKTIFDIHNGCYTEDGEFLSEADPKYGLTKYYPAPTQSLLQKWLREKHKIEISIETIWADKFRTTPNYIPWVYYTLEEEDEKLEDESPIYFKTYEEALEIGLQEALNTIK